MDIFAENKHFQFGTKNPTLMVQPFWKYMVCNPELTAYGVSKNFKSDVPRLPIWCFARFGATQTYLPDGRLICIGGEHEDSYDPDFQIYNDVVVIQNPHPVQGIYPMPVPSNFLQAKKINKNELGNKILGTSNVNDVTIYGYPLDVFPPTDFHTATYVQSKNKKEYIYIIGGTGCTCAGFHKPEPCNLYHHDEHARIYRLCLSDFSIERVETSGTIPRGCTSGHIAKLLTVKGRHIIQIEISLVNVKMCNEIKISSEDPKRTRSLDDKHSTNVGWGDHYQAYRLDIGTGVWEVTNPKI